MKKLVFIAILSAVGLFLYKKTSAALKLTYEILSIELKQFNWNDFRMIVRTNIKNESNQSLLLNSVDGSIFIDGNNTGTINQVWNETLTPGNNNLRIEIVFNVKATLRNLFQNYSGKRIISFVGELKFEGVTLPVKYEYAYGR